MDDKNSIENEFICLECGSKRCSAEEKVTPIIDENDPWSYVTSRDECWDCKARMPRALARRWNLSYEEAKAEWQSKYRKFKQSNVN